MNRRNFLHLLAGAAAAGPLARAATPVSDPLGKLLPLRPLGRSGVQVTCLGLGGYHVGWTTEALAQATIEAALAEGVRFFDTAESYGPHTSEERYGKFLTPAYRDRVFLMSKSTAKTAAEAQEHLEGSLRRLKTDRLDLWQIHALDSADDVDARLAAGVLDYALKARAEKKVRFIGFTGHRTPVAHRRMLERTAGGADPFIACQFPINPVDAASSDSFVETALPAATKRGLGILAMKTLADGRFFGSKVVRERTVWTTETPIVPTALGVGDCIHFALSLPIAVLITGAENPELLREKAGLVRTFAALSEAQRKAIVTKVARHAEEGQVEYYKRGPQRPKKAKT
jgi:aryl-alcohol dehydrogenase-like predicted oxidoreductase